MGFTLDHNRGGTYLTKFNFLKFCRHYNKVGQKVIWPEEELNLQIDPLEGLIPHK